jgi:hypothetical protein
MVVCFSSCEKDDLTSTFETEAAMQVLAPPKVITTNDQLARQVAVGYHNRVMDVLGNIESFQQYATTVQYIDGSARQYRAPQLIKDYHRLGYLKTDESQEIEAFYSFIEEIDLDDYTYVNEVEKLFQRYRATNGIIQSKTPLTYFTSNVAEAILTNSQATLLWDKEVGSNTNADEKRNDGLLCFVRHRNWLSARLGLCGAANNSVIASLISAGVQNSLSQAATNEFNDLSGDLAVLIFGGGAEELTGLESLGLTLFQNAVAATIEDQISSLWNSTWCSAVCDDCGPALGIARRFIGCNFVGIRAIGSAFEEGELWEWLLDYNRDFIQDDMQLSFMPDLPSTAISNSGIFNARVDVFCDGLTAFPWTGGALWAEVNPERDFDTPTATIGNPEFQNTGGGPLNIDTQACFTASNVMSLGYTSLGWSLSIGGITQTQPASSQLCTDFLVNSPTWVQASLRFQDQCTGSIVLVPGQPFLLCPGGPC